MIPWGQNMQLSELLYKVVVDGYLFFPYYWRIVNASMILWNLRNDSAIDTTSHSRRSESLAALLWGPHILVWLSKKREFDRFWWCCIVFRTAGFLGFLFHLLFQTDSSICGHGSVFSVRWEGAPALHHKSQSVDCQVMEFGFSDVWNLLGSSSPFTWERKCPFPAALCSGHRTKFRNKLIPSDRELFWLSCLSH